MASSSMNLLQWYHYHHESSSYIPDGGDHGHQQHRHPPTGSRNTCSTDNDENNSNDRNKRIMMIKQTEDFLASILNKLSSQERKEAFEDVHCVGEGLKETPKMMKNALAEFASVIQKDYENKCPVYQLAAQQNRAYVEDNSFRLKFLRANSYNVEDSVREMMRFLLIKEIYFGIDKVARDITLDDLNEEDMKVLQSGMWHIQKERDQSGRVILHVFSNMQWKAENTIRAAYFLFMNILTSELVVQTKGVVKIIHNVVRSGQNIMPMMPEAARMMTIHDVSSSFPVRCSATHYCFHQAGWQGNMHFSSFLRTALKILPLYETARSRLHVGDSVEIRNQLRTHGIPVESCPVDGDGKVREGILNVCFNDFKQAETSKLLLSPRGDHDNNSTSVAVLASINERRHSTAASSILQQVPMGSSHRPNSNNRPIEIQGNPSVPVAASEPRAMMVPPVAHPSEYCVLLGRGRFARSSPGNVRFRAFIARHSDDYDRLSRNERKKKSMELTETLIALGLRFYSQDGLRGEWMMEVVDRQQVRKTVCQLLRTLKKGKRNGG